MVGLIIGVVIVGGIYLASLFAPLPYSPSAINASQALQGPSSAHWFGTDSVGADVFSRTIAAGRVDLTLTLVGTALALIVGVAGGLLASTRNPAAERFMRFIDGLQALPLLILTLALVTLFGDNIALVAVTMALVSGPHFIRLVRSQALSVRESRYVEAAFASGGSWSRVMIRHVLPNIRAMILTQTAQVAGTGLLLVAALSFLGVGIKPPTPSWGAIIQLGSTEVVNGYWWIATAGGLALFLCVLSFNPAV
jgi:peptide/nickel transport system permease protein